MIKKVRAARGWSETLGGGGGGLGGMIITLRLLKNNLGK